MSVGTVVSKYKNLSTAIIFVLFETILTEISADKKPVFLRLIKVKLMGLFVM